ncbi:MAG: hypothetical protein ACKVS7_14520 [Gemmatimonadaceae bacterium]
MLRSLVALGLAVVLSALSVSSSRQFPSEFGQSEPGSLLFGLLHLTIAVSAAVSAVGVLMRAHWAPRAIALCGAAATGLLAVQPMFTSMDSDTREVIWLGAGLVGAASAGAWWIARRLARTDDPAGERVARTARPPEREAPLLGAARSVDLGLLTERGSGERVHRDARGDRVESHPQRDSHRGEH